jgi:glycosyltransferase involved in cell wall biosynthesis
MKVSIAIPFYNAEKYLRDSIRSVFAQTHQDWELILMDDGSTDGSLVIAKSIKDPRVSVYSDGQNKKLAARLNEITKLAKYDIIARMDADDLMSPTRIEKQLNILKDNLNIDLVSTGLFSVSDNLDILGARCHHHSTISFHDLISKNGCGIVHASIIGRKEWFLRNKYDTKLKLAQDYDLWLRASKNNDLNIFLMNEPLYYYREIGSINPIKMLLAYSYERQMYKKYVSDFKFLVFKSYLKSIIVKFLCVINQFQFLINRRSNQVIDTTVLKRTNLEIQTIENTNVNGLI